MYFSRVLAFVVLAMLGVALVPGSTAAQGKPGMPASASQALATVRQFIDGFNKSDTKSALATRAYLVASATYSFKVHGKPVTESDSVFTVALQRLGGAWRITGWAWAAH